ncbi:hypothetical protein D7X55_33920 [Corallococcus sp. AB049A]|uniref:DUF5666 domain-containing protein n=1 Tax=Corallococcus interemptor TaxID=2316720 RepID=A0A3A8QVZ7_9BACT|nr:MULTISPECIES: hypothetical protein [Corallococcus]RKH54274.1 hypothetical protein D7Y23_01225 [Corallococcus sp. AB050B]RKH67314.1 hypothetical protein D7X96_19635 [Corallococcus interemptor]RKI51491.1 hypothetical protein D7X55_33920 [Corallococcus sp. AB049A]
MFMKKAAIGLGLAMLAVGGNAWAGFKQGFPVVIHTSVNAFGGDIGAIRNTADNMQFIQITFEGRVIGNNSVMFFVRDASGNSAMCSSSDPKILEAAHSITSDSAIMVYHDGAGSCNNVQVIATSVNPPKQP